MSHAHFRLTAIFASSAIALLASGCASITGLDGTSSYSCKAPQGVKCDSVSGTYYNAIQNNLPSQRRSPTSQGGAEAPTAPANRHEVRMVSTTARTSPAGEASYHAAPLRAAPRVMRLWIKPWEDADRDLNGESLVYVQIDNGRWLVDHAQRQAREPYAPVRPGKVPTASSAKAGNNEPARPPSAAQAQLEEGASMQVLRALQGRAVGSGDN